MGPYGKEWHAIDREFVSECAESIFGGYMTSKWVYDAGYIDLNNYGNLSFYPTISGYCGYY